MVLRRDLLDRNSRGGQTWTQSERTGSMKEDVEVMVRWGQLTSEGTVDLRGTMSSAVNQSSKAHGCFFMSRVQMEEEDHQVKR